MADRFDIYETRAKQIFDAFDHFDPNDKSAEAIAEVIRPGLERLQRDATGNKSLEYAQTLHRMIHQGSSAQQKVAKYYVAQALFMTELLKRADQPANQTKDQPVCKKLVAAIPASPKTKGFDPDSMPDIERYRFFGDIFRHSTKLRDDNRISAFTKFAEAGNNPSSCQVTLGAFSTNQMKQDWARFFEGAMLCFKDQTTFDRCVQPSLPSSPPSGRR